MSDGFDILFASSDPIAIETIDVINKNFKFSGILTTQNIQSGRKVKDNLIIKYAQEHSIPLFIFEHLLQEERDIIKKTGANFLISFSYSKIFGPKFLSIFSKGTMNIHPSLLPQYRGPSPIQTALINCDKKSGITFQSISLGIDEGDVYKKIEFDISDDDDIVTLRKKISALASLDIKNVLQNDIANPKKQEGEATYTSLFTSSSGKIDWQSDTAGQIFGKYRAFLSWPRTYAFFEDKKIFFDKMKPLANKSIKKPGEVICYDKSIKAFIISTSTFDIALFQLMKEGGKTQSAEDFKNGHKNFIGSILS